MNFMKKLQNEQSDKITLLETIKNLSSNLQELKSTLSQAFSDNQSTKAMEKLTDIYYKQTLIMNKIRQGLEKQTSSFLTPKTSRIKVENKQFETKLQQQFQEQKQLEQKRTSHLESINNNIHTLFSSLKNNIGKQQQNKNQNDQQFNQLIEALKIDPESKKLQNWAGNLYVKTVVNSYQQHIKGNQSFDDTKMEMSFQIISKYRKFVLKLYQLQFDLSVIQKIEQRFQRAATKAISYLVTKCPMSKHTIDISIFEKLGNRLDESKHPDHDLLYQLGITFDLSSNSLGPTLKQFIGKLINQVHRFYPSFKNFIHKIADGADNNESKNRLTYDIERKILQGVAPYSDEQIKTPGFFTKSSELMRTLTKWIQFLIDPFLHPEKIIQNYSVFRNEDELERLNHKQKEDMASKFQKRKEKMKQIMSSMGLLLTRTISSIIVISNSPIKSSTIQSFPFLDDNNSGLLLVCRFIWKTIEGFANEIIRQIIKLYKQISDQYHSQNKRENSFNLYGFFIQDLIGCNFKGGKQSILFIYNNLLKEQKQNNIKILQVSNNLEKPSQNIIVLFKHKDSFLTFELCFHLTGKKGDQKDEFNRFLRQLQKTILSPTFMLASNLINLNPVKEYLKKYKPHFKPSIVPFEYSFQNKRIICRAHSQTPLKQGSVNNSFVCNTCFLFIESYSHYFSKDYCTSCFLNICFPCKLAMLPQQEAFQYLLSSVKYVKQYFTSLQIFKFLKPKSLKQKIQKYLRDKGQDYLLLVSYQNSTTQVNMWLLKSLVHQDQELILTNFKNQIFDFQKLDKSIIVVLKPSFPLQLQSSDAQYQYLYTLQDMMNEQQQQSTKYIEIENSYGKRIIIDYQIRKPSQIKQLISQTAMDQIISSQNKMSQGKLLFNKLIIDFKYFKQLQTPSNILVLDLNQCQLDTSNELQQLNIFTSLQQIFVSNTKSFKYKQFQFDKSIVSINITQCQLSQFKFQFPRLKQLRLIRNKICFIDFKQIPKLHTLRLGQNELTSFYNLAQSNFTNLLKLDLKSNNIGEQLPVLKFQKLRLLELSQNYITNIKNLSISRLPNLRQLNLNSNKIQILPDFSNLNKLDIFKLFNNKITFVQGTCNDNIKLLDLSFNQIQKIPTIYYPSLEQLHLQCNQISSFGELKHSNLSKLQILSIQHNPIQKGKILSLSTVDSLRIHPDGIQFSLDPTFPSKCNQNIVCSKCQNEIKVVSFYQKIYEILCQKCHQKSPNKKDYKQVYILDRSIISKYA